jgi:hypothetical protein
MFRRIHFWPVLELKKYKQYCHLIMGRIKSRSTIPKEIVYAEYVEGTTESPILQNDLDMWEGINGKDWTDYCDYSVC